MTCANLRSEMANANDNITLGGCGSVKWSEPSRANGAADGDRSRKSHGPHRQSAGTEVCVTLRQCPNCKQILSNYLKVCIHCDEVIIKGRSKLASKAVKIACVLVGLQLINTAHAFYNSPGAERISMSGGQVEILRTPNLAPVGRYVPK